MKKLEDLGVNDYLAILRRRIWYLVLPAVVLSIGTAVYVSQVPSLYRSDTTLQVASRIVPEDYIGSLVRESTTDRIDFVRQQIRSRTFLERIAQEFQLGGGINTDRAIGALLSNT